MKNSKKIRRAAFVVCLLLTTSIGIMLVLDNFNDNIVFFFTPSELMQNPAKKTQNTLRIGGLVVPDSIQQSIDDNHIATAFVITDCSNKIKVRYDKPLPSLFREKQGVVVRGSFTQDNTFIAQELLIKHDEKYRPPTVKWQPAEEDFCKIEKNASN